MASIAKPDKFNQSSRIRWRDKKFKSPELCLSFYVFLSGSFEKAQVIVEKSDSSFDLKEIKGGINEWTEVRFHLTLGYNDTLYFEVRIVC